MALTTTTLSSAVAVTDVSIVVTSATGFAANSSVIIDGENMRVGSSYVSGTTIPVSRGRDGTATTAHASGANVSVELGSDLAGPVPATIVQWPNVKGRRYLSTTTAGAVPLPNQGSDLFYVINGTSALAITLAIPTKDMDGVFLWVASNGKAAHTLTLAGGGTGNAGAGYTVYTYTTGSQETVALVALNGIWQPQQSGLSGTLTAILVALA